MKAVLLLGDCRGDARPILPSGFAAASRENLNQVLITNVWWVYGEAVATRINVKFSLRQLKDKGTPSPPPNGSVRGHRGKKQKCNTLVVALRVRGTPAHKVCHHHHHHGRVHVCTAASLMSAQPEPKGASLVFKQLQSPCCYTSLQNTPLKGNTPSNLLWCLS